MRDIPTLPLRAVGVSFDNAPLRPRYVFQGSWEDTVGSHLFFGQKEDGWEGGAATCQGSANKKIRFVRVQLEEKGAQPQTHREVLEEPLNLIQPGLLLQPEAPS